jgi:segregation and condensation protein A
MSRVYARLMKRGRLAFYDLFDRTMHKSKLVGIFLAVLELVRHHRARVEQNALFGEIWLLPDPSNTGPLDFSNVDEYEHAVRTD